jgi:cellulose synthase/poly-beta-1,6-N-acetylglucosamine synthase-like glycosyltransferase
LIHPDFVRKIKAQWNGRDQALQCFVSPVGFEHSSISTLIAFSELVEQTVFDGLRSFLGWPVRLRGTGMVISPKLLSSVSDRVQTEVEDIALNLLLAENGIRVKRINSAVVYDPKPTEAAAATRQRARWFRGQWAALWQYRSTVAKIAAQGPAGWSLLGSLFMKPRWLMLALKIVLALVFFRLPLVSGTLGSLVLCDLLLILGGLFRMRERNIFLKAILHLPGFVFMWLGGILLSFRCRSWLRVRETRTFPHRLPQGFGQARVLKPVKVNSSQMDLLYPPGGSS